MQMAKGGSETSLCEEADSAVFGSHVLFVSVVCVLPLELWGEVAD